MGELDGSGQRLFGWGPPTGHPDENDYWLSSYMMRRRWSLLIGLADDAWKAGPSQAAAAIAEAPTPESAVNAAYRRLLGREAPPNTAHAIISGLGLKPGLPFDTRRDALPMARRMLAYCAMTPAFQSR